MYEIGQEEIDAVAKVIRSKQLFRYRGGEGAEVDTFEKRLREKLGVNYFLTTSSGTAALICGLVGMEVGPGDEVIIPAYTFIATGLAVLNVGAIPVVAEIDESLCIDPADIKKKITKHTKAIIPVDMVGLPCDMDAIMQIADKRGIFVLEDACQAVGGSYKGKMLTTIGQAGAFSFNQFKNITCGEGGGLATNDINIYQRALIYHDCGCVFRSYAEGLQVPFFAGDNYRSNEISGAILNIQLGRLDSILERLRERKAAMVKKLEKAEAFKVAPTNDAKGDCGSSVCLIFKTAEERVKFCAKIKEIDAAYAMGSPIDSGRHVYTNWKPFIEQMGGYVPAMDAYKRKENKGRKMKLAADSCPKTLDILARTAYMFPNLDNDVAYYEKMAEAMVKVGEMVCV